MDSTLIAGCIGVIGALLGTIVQHFLQFRQSDRSFQRQRELIRDEFARNVTKELNQELSFKLDFSLRHGEALIDAGHRIGVKFLKLEDMTAREARLAEFMSLKGLNDESGIIYPGSLEDDELRDLVIKHRSSCIELWLMYVLDESEEFKTVKLHQTMKSVSDSAQEIEMRRRLLLRQGSPL